MRTILGVLALAVLGGCEKQPELCYVDCRGGFTCHEGRLFYGGYATGYEPGKAPCSSDPIEACLGNAQLLYTCSKSCGSSPSDTLSRYQDAINPYFHPPEHLLRLYCAEGAPKTVGDPCSTDVDCRPATSLVSRLSCSSGKCAEVPRPAAPAGYGQACGETWAHLAELGGIEPDEFVVFTETSSCSLCALTGHSDGCLKQACSMPCEYDEDCPEGSVCTAGRAGSSTRLFCATARTDKDFQAGALTDFLKCQTEPDAGL